MRNWTLIRPELLVVTLLSFSAMAQAGVTGVTEPFVERQPVTLKITASDGRPLWDTEVAVVYYPGADIEREVAIGTTDDVGEVTWSPEFAGLARVDVMVIPGGPKDAVMSRVVGVRYARMPIGALVMFSIAVFMLFGGLIVGGLKMRGHGE